jgi:lipid-binding SYLF domain-containing protein
MKTAHAIAAVAAVALAGTAQAASREEIADNVGKALGALYQETPAAEDLADKAEGILVFPAVYKAGIGIGGALGEGALVVDDKAVAFYNIAGASAGLQLGAQKQSIVLMFMTEDALEKFRRSQGWNIGVDAGVTVLDREAAAMMGTETFQQPVVAFVYSGKGPRT